MGFIESIRLSVIQRRTLGYVVLVIVVILYVMPAQLRPADFLQDDSYFYLQVASNILRGNGSTFHTITPTNGYHPLWMLFSILGLSIAGNDKTLGLNVILGLQTLLFLGTAYYFRQIVRLVSGGWWMVGVAILASYFLGMGVYASEAHLNAFMLVLGIYYFFLATQEDSTSNWIKAGLLSGLAVLARLDNVFMIGSLFLLGLLSHQERSIERTLKRSLILSLSFACVVTPYLFYNYFSYGHLVPISGTIKSTFPVVTADIRSLGRFGRITSVFGPVSVLLSLDPGLNKPQKALLRILGIGVLLHASYIVLFTDHYTFWPWYYVSGVLNLGFASGFALHRAASALERYTGRKWIALMKGMAIVLLIAVGIARGWAKAYYLDSIGPLRIPQINQYRWPNEVAVWMRDNIPPGSRVFVHDWPGAIAYYSDLNVLPMDGLMSDFKYNYDLLNQGANKYLCANNVHYFLGPEQTSQNGVQKFEVLAPLFREPAGELQLKDRDLVMRVRDIVKSPQEAPPLAIWRIDTCNDAR